MPFSVTYTTHAREYVQRILETTIPKETQMIIAPLFPAETIAYSPEARIKTVEIIETAESDPCSKNHIRLSICCNDAWMSTIVQLPSSKDSDRIGRLNRAAQELESQFLTAIKFSQESRIPEWPALSKIASLKTQI
jgi:hypothetical protein